MKSLNFSVDDSTPVSVENELRLPRINFLFMFPDEVRGLLTVTRWNHRGSDWEPTEHIKDINLNFA